MKVPITVSLCLSKDFIVDAEDATLENLYDAFLIQHGLPSGVSFLDEEDWIVNELEICQ